MLHNQHGTGRTSSETRQPATKRRESRPRGNSGSRHVNSIRSCRLHDRVGMDKRDALICEYLEGLDCPRALTVWLCYKYGSHRTIVELTSNPLWFCDDDADSFRRYHAATKFLSKCRGLRTEIDTKEVALASAVQAEDLCKLTNARLRKFNSTENVSSPFHAILFRAQTIVSKILGVLPQSFEDVGWSKGRTSSSFGAEIASIHKYASRADVTRGASLKALCLLRLSPHWGASVISADAPCSVLLGALTQVKGNTLITVPKSAKTDRTICYEPHMNIRLQLAVGSFIRRRLSKHGVRLEDQSINQRRAQIGSITDLFATIDLKMASDTLASELVYTLLPIDWALMLNDLRSEYTTWPDGSCKKNEKFSSMGNGFTFELESLIFYALSSAVTEDVSVYGDDIIVPTQSFKDVSDILEFCGFSLNMAKSFAASPFRESCGADYFGGVDVTPVYLRELPKLTEHVVKFHNAIRSFCSRAVKPVRKWEVLLRSWRDVHTCHHGPSGYGDGHYHVDFDAATPRAAFDIDGWWFKTYIPVYRDNKLYGDRLSGSFPDRISSAALCSALGPRSARSLWDLSVDRRLWVYRQHRALAHFEWPVIVWE